MDSRYGEVVVAIASAIAESTIRIQADVRLYKTIIIYCATTDGTCELPVGWYTLLWLNGNGNGNGNEDADKRK